MSTKIENEMKTTTWNEKIVLSNRVECKFCFLDSNMIPTMELLLLNCCRLNSKPLEVGKSQRLLIVVTSSAQSTTICLDDAFKKKIKINGACR